MNLPVIDCKTYCVKETCFLLCENPNCFLKINPDIQFLILNKRSTIKEITYIPNFLYSLTIDNSSITSIKELPTTLRHFSCENCPLNLDNNLNNLNNLNLDFLDYLNCSRTNVTKLNIENSSIKMLKCEKCPITQLTLPKNLERLYCADSKLIYLSLPASCTYIDSGYCNNLTEINWPNDTKLEHLFCEWCENLHTISKLTENMKSIHISHTKVCAKIIPNRYYLQSVSTYNSWTPHITNIILQYKVNYIVKLQKIYKKRFYTKIVNLLKHKLCKYVSKYIISFIYVF